MAVKAWLEALGVTQEKYLNWQKQLPKNESLLRWCLLNQKISSTDYFAWAAEYYGLAVLKQDFFNQAPNIKLWQQIQSVANWSNSFMPILEWDGVIFIACLEPREDVTWSFTVRYVLADAASLDKYWQTLHQPTMQTAPVPVPVPAPAPTIAQNSPSISSLEPSSLTPPTHFSDQPEGLTLNLKLPETPPLPALDAPEGFHFTAAPEGLANDTSAPLVQPNKTLDAPEGIKLDAPIGLSFDAPEGLSSSVIQFKQASVPATLNDATEIVTEKDNSVATAHSQTNYSEFLFRIENDFLGGMILAVQNEQFQSLAWDTKFKPTTQKAQGSWSLSNPSAFRVAFRTKLPYLGHVVDTPINKDFFSSWGYEELPKQILIQPVIANHKVQYFLLLLTDSNKKNHMLLSAAEKLGAEWLLQSPKNHAA